MDEKKITEYLTRLAHAPNFTEGYFDIPVGDGVYLLGATSKNEHTKILFESKAYYDDVVDLINKIRLSFDSAKDNSLLFSDDGYNPFDKPNDQEFFGSYFAENAMFRVAILWDILAQLYNLKYHCNYPEKAIKYKRIFHNNAIKGEPFAKKVYDYITEEDGARVEDDTEMWKGNHAFVTEFRNSFVHRISQNLTAFTATSFNLRPPIAYLFKRVLEDYTVVLNFLIELFISIHDQYFTEGA